MENGPDLEFYADIAAKAQQARKDFAEHKPAIPTPAEKPKPEEEGWSEIDKVVKPVYERAVLEKLRAQKRQAQEEAAKKQYEDLEGWYRQQGQEGSVQAANIEIQKAQDKFVKDSETANRFAALLDRGKEKGVISQEEITNWEAKAQEKVREEEARQMAAAAELVDQEVVEKATQEIEIALIDLGKLAEKLLQLGKWDLDVVLNNVQDIIFRLNTVGAKVGRNWLDLAVSIPGGISLLDQISQMTQQQTVARPL